MPVPNVNVKDLVARSLSGFHKVVLDVSGGRLGGRIMGMPVLVLTTTGRKSGEPRSTTLTYHEIDGHLVLVASYGGDDRDPQWFKNLVATPAVTIDRSEGGGDEAMTARVATAAEKTTWWPTITTTYSGYAGYQKKTSRQIPLVVLDPARG